MTHPSDLAELAKLERAMIGHAWGAAGPQSPEFCDALRRYRRLLRRQRAQPTVSVQAPVDAAQESVQSSPRTRARSSRRVRVRGPAAAADDGPGPRQIFVRLPPPDAVAIGRLARLLIERATADVLAGEDGLIIDLQVPACDLPPPRHNSDAPPVAAESASRRR